MTSTSTSPARSASPAERRSAFRPILILLSAFVGVSTVMEVLLAALTVSGVDVAIAIWIRCSLVLASSVLLLLFGIGAARGSRSSWVRLSIVAPVVVVAVIVIVSIPGFLPDWVRIQQALCGLLVLPVAILAVLPRTRALFPRKR
ncbi:hypothetical protein [Leifsonia sp. SIMBA_070]|uniref:hypothetical protein n=1 Tax=Leifsonia sp. SIMBA_070 TaxID=3085810 RepID=UPI00397BBCF7